MPTNTHIELVDRSRRLRALRMSDQEIPPIILRPLTEPALHFVPQVGNQCPLREDVNFEVIWMLHSPIN